MRVRIFAILGVLIGAFMLIVATLTLNGTTLQSFQALDHQARTQDKSVASTSPQPCANPRLAVNAPTRVLMVRETDAISTQVTNQDTVMCDITLSLVAPTFTLQPRDNQRLIQLAPTASATVTWRVTPTTVGLATLAFTAGNASEQIGLSVMSGNGFVPYQSQTFDYLAIFLGFLLTLASLVAWQWWPNRRTRTPQRTETTERSTPATAGHPVVSPPEPARVG